MSKQLELARRAAACRHWRWVPGMMDEHGWRVVSGDGELFTWARKHELFEGSARGELPDLADPPTRACLLELVRQAWGDQEAWIQPCDHDAGGNVTEWVVRAFRGGWWSRERGCGASPEAALVAALEAAP